MASEYNHQAACDAADTYLLSLELHHIGEVEPRARLVLARALMEELPQLEATTQQRFKEARAELFNVINCALGSFDSATSDWPNAADLAENLGLIGCRDKDAKVSYENILKKLKGI